MGIKPVSRTKPAPEQLKHSLLYELYGIPVKSDLKLNARPAMTGAKPRVFISRAPRGFFKNLPHKKTGPSAQHPIDYQLLMDGSVYVRFFHLFQFWVARNGCRILHEKTSAKRTNTPHVPPIIFLQTNVFSFCLLRLGFEAFHASAIQFGDKAVAFLGESGYGKSTLAASFLKQGFPLLTDDIFALYKKGRLFLTPPGAAQIKLWPEPAKKLLREINPSSKMSPIAKKWILRLDSKTMGQKSMPVGLIYVLWPRFKKGGKSIWIRKLKPQESVISLVKSSHNLVLQDSKRLQRQLRFVTEMVKEVPVRAVSYPMDFNKIGLLRNKLEKDIRRVFERSRKPKHPTAVPI